MLKYLIAIGCGIVLNGMAIAVCAEVVPVVSIQSPLTTLSRAQLTDIYLGKTTQLPGGERVIPIDQSERSPAHDEFYREYLGRSAAQIKAHWSRLIFTGRGQPPRSVSDNEALVELVSENPNTIGYIDSSYLIEQLRVVNIE